MLDTPEENTPQETTHNYIDLTADIVSAYVAKNSVRPADLGDLIASVHQTLKGLSGPTTPVADQIKKLTPLKSRNRLRRRRSSALRMASPTRRCGGI